MQENRILILPTVLFTFVLIYGVNLYFSLNGDLNDPDVSPVVPLAKDAILAVTMGGYALLQWRRLGRVLRDPVVLALGAFVATSSIVAVGSFGVNLPTLSTVKNLTLYFFGGMVVTLLLVEQFGIEAVRRVVVRAIYASLVASVLMLLHPVQSYDGRLYGTYGNPTSLGFATVVLLGVALWRGSRIEWIIAAIACAIISVMSGSASVMISAVMLMAGWAGLEFLRTQCFNSGLAAMAVYLGAFAMAGVVCIAAGFPAFGFIRIVQFFDDPSLLMSTDSLTVRVRDYRSARETVGAYHRYDAFLLTVWRNFGLIPLLAYAAFVATVTLAFFRSNRGARETLLIVLAFVLFVINPLLQHQIEVFPTNGLFAAVLALTVSQFKAP